jgi:hypothetical protein
VIVHYQPSDIQSQLPPAAPGGNLHSLLHAAQDTGSDSDLPPAEVIIERALQLSDKVPGLHHLTKGKGKEKADTLASSSKCKASPTAIAEPVPKHAKWPKVTQKELAPKKDLASKCVKHGRQPGSLGYSPADLIVMLDLIENHLPISAKEWEKVAAEYETYCKERNCATHTAKALELKFKQV